MTDRMPGRFAQPWCPHCHAPSGPDCPDRSASPRQVRARLKRELRQNTPPAPGFRCADVNLPLGLRCDRPHGHTGAHVQDNGASQQGWGFALNGYTTTTETTTAPARTGPLYCGAVGEHTDNPATTKEDTDG